MKIAIYCVTYHTYQELDAYLSNIEERLQGCTQIELSVNVCDNTEGEILPINYKPKRFTINVFGVHRNLGYFGGIRYSSCDYRICSSVKRLVGLHPVSFRIESK